MPLTKTNRVWFGVLVTVTFAAFAAIFLLSCERSEVKKIKLFQPVEKKEAATQKIGLRVGIAAIISPKEGFIYYRELLDYLGEEISRPINLRHGNYDEINELLGKGKLDLVFICSGPYIDAHRKFGSQLLVCPVVKGKSVYYANIIVHKDSPVKNFDQLREKTFAFTHPLSATGFIFPAYLLAQKGVKPQDYFSKTIFTNSHDNSVIAVAEKLVDGAAVDHIIYDHLAKTDPQLIKRTRVIATSPPIGIPPIVVPKDLEPKLKKNLEDFFLNLDQEERGRQILAKLGIDRFVKPEDKWYDSLRSMKAAVEKTLASEEK